MYTHRLIFSFILPVFIGFFWSSQVLSVGAVDSCNWLWSDALCSSPNKINIDCGAGGCTLSGGVKIAELATQGNLSNKPIHLYITDIIRYFLGFVSLVAVIYIIYAGFRLMVSGGDEEASKKSRQIIIYVIAGIVIMWSAYWLVKILIQAF